MLTSTIQELLKQCGKPKGKYCEKAIGNATVKPKQNAAKCLSKTKVNTIENMQKVCITQLKMKKTY